MNKYVYVIRLLNGRFVKEVSFNLESDTDDIQLNVVSNVSQALQFTSKDLAESCCSVLHDYGYQSMPMGFVA